MEKEVFEQSLDEMLEMDTSLDINSMLDSIPAIETIEDNFALHIFIIAT